MLVESNCRLLGFRRVASRSATIRLSVSGGRRVTYSKLPVDSGGGKRGFQSNRRPGVITASDVLLCKLIAQRSYCSPAYLQTVTNTSKQ